MAAAVMEPFADHRCRVFDSPWPEVHGTRIDSSRHYGRHWHATHGIGLIEAGAQRSASGRGCVDAMAGDVIACNPGEVHDGKPLGGASRRWRMVYLQPGFIRSMAGDSDRPALGDLEFHLPVMQDRELAAALHRLFIRLDARLDARNSTTPRFDPCRDLACDEALTRVCGLLSQRSAPPPASNVDAALHRVRDRLVDDPLRAPTLAELAHLAGLSRFQLLRRFTASFGVPPHAWLLQWRAERARELIRRGMSLAAAADCCGFSDQSHMTRFFSRQFGFTPGAWQRAAPQ